MLIARFLPFDLSDLFFDSFCLFLSAKTMPFTVRLFTKNNKSAHFSCYSIWIQKGEAVLQFFAV